MSERFNVYAISWGNTPEYLYTLVTNDIEREYEDHLANIDFYNLAVKYPSKDIILIATGFDNLRESDLILGYYEESCSSSEVSSKE